MACEHPFHWAHCSCGYKIEPYSDFAVEAKKRQERAEAELEIEERYKDATYSEAVNQRLIREAKTRLFLNHH